MTKPHPDLSDPEEMLVLEQSARNAERGDMSEESRIILALTKTIDDWKQRVRELEAERGQLKTLLHEVNLDRKAGEARIAELEAERDLRGAQLLMVASELHYDRKIDPHDTGDPRWTPALTAAANLRAEVERLRAVPLDADGGGLRERVDTVRLDFLHAADVADSAAAKDIYETVAGRLRAALASPQGEPPVKCPACGQPGAYHVNSSRSAGCPGTGKAPAGPKEE